MTYDSEIFPLGQNKFLPVNPHFWFSNSLLTFVECTSETVVGRLFLFLQPPPTFIILLNVLPKMDARRILTKLDNGILLVFTENINNGTVRFHVCNVLFLKIEETSVLCSPGYVPATTLIKIIHHICLRPR